MIIEVQLETQHVVGVKTEWVLKVVSVIKH